MRFISNILYKGKVKGSDGSLKAISNIWMKKNGALIPYVKPYAKVNGVLEPLWYVGGLPPIWDEEEWGAVIWDMPEASPYSDVILWDPTGTKFATRHKVFFLENFEEYTLSRNFRHPIHIAWGTEDRIYGVAWDPKGSDGYGGYTGQEYLHYERVTTGASGIASRWIQVNSRGALHGFDVEKAGRNGIYPLFVTELSPGIGGHRLYTRQATSGAGSAAGFVEPGEVPRIRPSGDKMAYALKLDSQRRVSLISGVHTSNVVKTITGFSYGLRDLKWSPNGRYFLTMDNHGNFEIYDVELDMFILTKENSESTSHPYYAWAPDSLKIVYARGTDVIVMNILDESIHYVFSGHTSNVQALDWSPDGKFIASMDSDKTIKVWKAPL